MKKVKRVLMTAADDDDLTRAMLAMMKTPIAPGQPSPAELHMGRCVRDEINPHSQRYQGSWEEFPEWKQAAAEKRSRYFNRGTKPLEPLKVGDDVMIWHWDEWQRGSVEEKLTRPRSYRVRVAQTGQQLERNRVLLRKIPQDTEDEAEKNANPFSVFQQAAQVPTHTLMEPAPAQTETTDDDLENDPDHENAEYESAEFEYELKNLEGSESESLPSTEDEDDDEEEEERDSSTSPHMYTRAGRPCRPPRLYTPTTGR